MSLMRRLEKVERYLQEQEGKPETFFVRYGHEEEDRARRLTEYRATHGRDPQLVYAVVDYGSAEKVDGKWTSTETYEEFNARLAGIKAGTWKWPVETTTKDLDAEPEQPSDPFPRHLWA